MQVLFRVFFFFLGQVCLPSIVDEFCRQAEAACLFTSSEEYIFNYSLESEHSRAFGGMERLDMFFPFDPCLLKKSDRYTFLAFGLINFRMKELLLSNSDAK
jgi:hypothetical protein